MEESAKGSWINGQIRLEDGCLIDFAYSLDKGGEVKMHGEGLNKALLGASRAFGPKLRELLTSGEDVFSKASDESKDPEETTKAKADSSGGPGCPI